MTGTEYVNLTITDNQNGNRKIYKVKKGSRLELTNSVYTINKNMTIDVTLPQYQALQAFDDNKDGKLDDIDKNRLYNADQTLTHNINSRLGKSNYKIMADGSGDFATVNEYGFFAMFENENWFESTENYDVKVLNFKTPKQAEYSDKQEAIQNKEKAEYKARKAKEEAELDKRYAEKHWFKYYILDINRQEYEKNNTRDY